MVQIISRLSISRDLDSGTERLRLFPRFQIRFWALPVACCAFGLTRLCELTSPASAEYLLHGPVVFEGLTAVILIPEVSSPV